MAKRFELRRTLYLAAPPSRVWKALTDSRATPKYYYGLKLRSNLRKGAAFEYEANGGNAVIRGRVLQARKTRKLVTTFAFCDLKEAASKVTFELIPHGRSTRLHFAHSGLAGRTTRDRVETGWEWILSGLKTFVETGRPLRA